MPERQILGFGTARTSVESIPWNFGSPLSLADATLRAGTPGENVEMKWMVIVATALLGSCAGPSLEAFNDRGGVIDYHMVNSSAADVLAVAERYCAGIGRKAK